MSGMAGRNDPSAFGSDDSDNHADAIFLTGEGIYTLGDQSVNFSGRRRNSSTRALHLLGARNDHQTRQSSDSA